jgi:protein-S-isoprenylcysteine O-methyltransferase Ste14
MANRKFLKLLVLFPIFICVFLFLPAGSFKFWEGWVYSATIFIPMVLTVSYLLKKDPALLERRMKLKEKEKKQKIIVKIFRLPFIIGFLIPAFDYRFNWSEVSPVIVVLANVMVFLGYYIVFLVFKENTYTSRIVEVEKDQKVISTGLYAIVRHPMYTGSILMFLFTPLALGSWWALIVFIFLPIVLIIRIYNEESVLLRDLSGYKEYCEKVRYRLIPYIW